jgi:transcriptional regulator with XRE-family HTH domain
VRARQIVGYNIRQERTVKGWSQAKLAEIMSGLLGTTWYPQTVGAAEQGERAFTVDDLVGLSRALGRTLEELTTPPAGETMDIGPGDATVTPDTVRAVASVPTPTVEERLVADLERTTNALANLVKSGATFKGNEVKVVVTKAKAPAKTPPKKRGKK